MQNINKSDDEYSRLNEKIKPNIPKFRNIIRAYLTGGTICLLGQSLWNIYMIFGFNQENAGIMSTITLILIGGLLTGIGKYDEISQFAGAGTIIPVTGFANAMVSPALEYKQDGLVLGMGSKLFSVAGPVLTYGMVSSFIIGFLKLIFGG